jgi:hypothetical protein
MPIHLSIALLIGVSCVSPSLLARPHILVLPILTSWTIGLLKARERDSVPWSMLPLMLAWANMHGSFIIGRLLVCPFAVEAIIEAGAAWRRATLPWALFLGGAIAIAAMTPYGVRGLVFPLQLMSLRQLGSIGEWQAPNFQSAEPVEAALMAVLYVCLSRSVRVPARQTTAFPRSLRWIMCQRTWRPCPC